MDPLMFPSGSFIILPLTFRPTKTPEISIVYDVK